MGHHGYWKTKTGITALLLALCCAGCALLGMWYRHIGTDADDAAFAIAKTSDNGYILAGFSEATPETSDNAHLTKINQLGLIQWQANFGDDRDDCANAVAQTTDGGYIVAGQFGDENSETSDAFLLKTDASGEEEWRQLFDSGGHDMAVSVQQTTDGGYLLGLEMDMLNTADATMLKTSDSGVEQWRSTAPEGSHVAKAIQTGDGGCVMAWWQIGFPEKTDATGKIGLRKTNASGVMVWEVNLYDEKTIELEDLCATKDGGLILTGQYDFLADDSPLFLWKTDAAGTASWRVLYGDESRSKGHAVLETKDGSFIVAGETHPVGRQTEAFLFKADQNGAMQWQRFYGGDDRDIGYDVLETECGYLMAGTSESSESEEEPDQSEILLVKTNLYGHSIGIEIPD